MKTEKRVFNMERTTKANISKLQKVDSATITLRERKVIDHNTTEIKTIEVKKVDAEKTLYGNSKFSDAIGKIKDSRLNLLCNMSFINNLRNNKTFLM